METKEWHQPKCIYCKKQIRDKRSAGGMTTVQNPKGDLEFFHWACHMKNMKKV